MGADAVAGDDGVVLRRATGADADALAELWWRARQASIPATPSPVHTLHEVRTWLADLIHGSGGAEVWVAVSAARDELGHVGRIGLLVLDGDGLDQLYVDPDSTGQGLGTRLVDLAKARRPDGLDLWTFQANTRARAFYRRQGFVEGRTTSGDNEEHAPDVRLSWRSTPPT